MILLTSTSDLLRVTTSSAAAVKVHASHVDRSGATITPGRLNTAIASATTTTIVASPAASTDRTVKFVSIYNDDASLSVTVTILHTDGTTAVDMWSATLAPQQGLQYDEGAGWSAPEGIYATAAQGALADTAVQPADDAADLGSGAATDGYVLTADGAGGAAWEAAGGGGTPGGSDTQVQFNDGGAFGGDSGFTFDKTNKTLGLGGGTITASDPIIDMAQTWNNGAVTFTAIKANVTDTASAAGSLLMDLQVGGVSKFSVGKSGALVLASNTLEQRNGTSAQAFNLYKTYTNDLNYERGAFKWNGNVLEIGTEAAGTGAYRQIKIGPDYRTPVGLSGGNATGLYAVAAGQSTASGSYTFAAGSSSAIGNSSVALGGGAIANGGNSVALGYLSNAYQGFQFALAFSQFATAGDCQVSTFVRSASTVDATPTEMLSNGTRMVIRASTTWAFEITVAARSDGGVDNAMYIRRGMIKRDASNNTTLVGTVDSVYTNETNAAWDVEITADDTNEALKVQVTGAAATNINWTAKVILTEVGNV